MANWYNDDGLLVRLGTTEADVANEGSYKTFGKNRVHEIELTLTDLTSTAGTIQSDVPSIPEGARIEKVTVVAETAATSAGSATLNIGLVNANDRSTEIDNDGLVAALALTSIDAAGDVVELVQGSTGHGALIGTTLSAPGVFSANYGTAAYTAGVVKILVEYYMP